MGINLLRQVDLRARSSMYTLAAALTMGLLPIVVPGIYSRFPATLQIVLNNGLAMGALTAVLVNIVFEHLHWRPRNAAHPSLHLETAGSDQRACH